MLLYILGINLIGIVLVINDKLSAKAHKQRIPEKTLVLTAFLGSALGQYICMKCIRHKTQKLKFMITYPVLIVIQIAVLYIIL